MHSIVAIAAMAAGAVTQPASAARPLEQGLLARLVGHWAISGTTRGKPTRTQAEVRSRFGGAFTELHIADPSRRNPYEASVFFGRAADGEIVVHWLDGTGAASSKTLGTGRVEGDRLPLDFAYPDGAMRNTLSYDRATDRWRMLIETGPADHPAIFADWHFTRHPAGG